MARGIDDVNAVILIAVRTIFRGNGDAPFPLQIHGIHQPLSHLLIVPEHAALAKELVYQCGFAMINMGDYGHITNIFLFHILPVPVSVQASPGP